MVAHVVVNHTLITLGAAVLILKVIFVIGFGGFMFWLGSKYKH